jgi:hypothetical protein
MIPPTKRKYLYAASWIAGFYSCMCAIFAPSMSPSLRIVSGVLIGAMFTINYAVVMVAEKHNDRLYEICEYQRKAIAVLSQLLPANSLKEVSFDNLPGESTSK